MKQYKLFITTLIFLNIFLGILFYATTTRSNSTLQFSNTTHIIGRQNHLIERYIEDILLTKEKLDQSHTKKIMSETVYIQQLLLESSNVLYEGGTVTRFHKRNEEIYSPPPPNIEIKKRLLSHKEQINELIKKAQELIIISRNDPTYNSKLIGLLKVKEKAIQDNYILKEDYTNALYKKANRLQTIQLISTTTILTLTFLFIIYFISLNQKLQNGILKREETEQSLKIKMEELKKLNKLMLGREGKILELKNEIKKLHEELEIKTSKSSV